MPLHLRAGFAARRSLAWRLRITVALVLALAAVAGCGTGTGPVDDLIAEGKVVLPPGSPLELTELVAAGPFGSSALDAQGAFAVPMASSGAGLVIVSDQAGDLVLMGFLGTASSGVVSAESTAAALLYFALGGPFMGAEPSGVLELLAADPETARLATAVAQVLAGDPDALATGDEGLLEAVEAAVLAIAARGESAAARSPFEPLAGSRPWQAEGSGNVVVLDAGARGGFELLVSEEGFGVVAQNSKRRPARLLLYRTGHKTEEGSVTMLDVPVAVGAPVVVPPTRSIDLLGGIEDALGGGAPLAPIESESVELPLVEGTTRTYYAAVLLTPSLTSDVPDVFTDPRFFPFRDQWDGVLSDLQWETWWTALFLPLFETMTFGVPSLAAYAQMAAPTAAVRASTEPVLAKAGASNLLTGDRAKALIAAIEEAALGPDSAYFYDLVEHARNAMGRPEPSAAELQGARSYLRTLAKAGTVLAVVELLMSGTDIVAMLYDLSTNGPAVDYEAVRLQTRAEVRPREGQVQRLVAPSVVFQLIVDTPLEGGSYLYRWSTTGEYGLLSDYLQEGKSFYSTSDEVFYLANEPAAITEELFDEVRVEVYLDDGSHQVPPGAEPVTVANATVVGKERRDLINGRFVTVAESYQSGEYTRYCVAAYVAFERQAGAATYLVDAFNFYDPYYYGGHFGTTVFESDHLPTYQPPCDERAQTVNGGEVYVFLSGGSGSQPPEEGWWRSRFEGMVVEVTVAY